MFICLPWLPVTCRHVCACHFQLYLLWPGLGLPVVTLLVPTRVLVFPGVYLFCALLCSAPFCPAMGYDLCSQVAPEDGCSQEGGSCSALAPDLTGN